MTGNAPTSLSHTLTAAEAARLLHAMGFNWLDVECVLELAPFQRIAGQARYRINDLERFVARAFWLNVGPLPLEKLTPRQSA